MHKTPLLCAFLSKGTHATSLLSSCLPTGMHKTTLRDLQRADTLLLKNTGTDTPYTGSHPHVVVAANSEQTVTVSQLGHVPADAYLIVANQSGVAGSWEVDL